jgi:hypothetical protein
MSHKTTENPSRFYPEAEAPDNEMASALQLHLPLAELQPLAIAGAPKDQRLSPLIHQGAAMWEQGVWVTRAPWETY